MSQGVDGAAVEHVGPANGPARDYRRGKGVAVGFETAGGAADHGGTESGEIGLGGARPLFGNQVSYLGIRKRELMAQNGDERHVQTALALIGDSGRIDANYLTAVKVEVAADHLGRLDCVHDA